MKWDVIAIANEEDKPDLTTNDRPRLVVGLGPDAPLPRMRESVLDRINNDLGRLPNPTAKDLLDIAMAVYSADLSISRQHFQDAWTRSFHLHMSVREPEKWVLAKTTLEQLLNFLSGDVWTIDFRQRKNISTEKASDESKNVEFDAVSLFSGGLDSLVGAIDLLAEGKKPKLVGHYGGGTTSKFQSDVHIQLQEAYDALSEASRFHVLPPALGRVNGDLAEDTQRTRSFLFFALGLAVASAIGPTVPLYVPENGLISLNVPLTGARSGSASTRTTHPYYVDRYRELLHQVGLQHELILPYKFKTKAEMFRECLNQELLDDLIPLTISCSHPEQRRYEGLSGGAHCGHCFPCLIRRATVAAAGFNDAIYDHDVKQETFSEGSTRGGDLRALRMALHRMSTSSSPRIAIDVLKSGPIDHRHIRGHIEVYKRGMSELRVFYGSHA